MTKGRVPARPIVSGGVRRYEDSLWLERLREEGPGSIPPGTPPPVELVKAIGEFNSGLFFQAHETLEDLWRVTPYPLRLFYHGIIKLAAGFHHVEQGNQKGALSLLEGAVRCLRPFGPRYMGVELTLLLDDTRDRLSRLDGVHWQSPNGLPRPGILFAYQEYGAGPGGSSLLGFGECEASTGPAAMPSRKG